MQPQQSKPQMDLGEPPSKRMRGEESLIPESEFMARHHSPVTFKVSVPNMSDKPGMFKNFRTWRISAKLFKHLVEISYIAGVSIEWGSEYRTSPVFKWSILPRTGHLITRPFENIHISPVFGWS
jgi:hypothetical protein